MTSSLQPLVLSAAPDEVLSGIVGVGNDFQFEKDRGHCRKHGGVLPVGVGQPTVLIKEMAVGRADPQVSAGHDKGPHKLRLSAHDDGV